MSKRSFKVGDRVVCYRYSGAPDIGTVLDVRSHYELQIKLDEHADSFYLHPKQCRLLKTKPKRVVYQGVTKLNADGNFEPIVWKCELETKLDVVMKALEFYADVNNYNDGVVGKQRFDGFYQDEGAKAREALKKIKTDGRRLVKKPKQEIYISDYSLEQLHAQSHHSMQQYISKRRVLESDVRFIRAKDQKRG